MSGLETHLSTDEVLIWQGAPSGGVANAAPSIIIRIASWVMLVCFVVVLLIGIANWDELDGAFGIWLGFLVLSGGTWAFLRIFMPWLIRTSHARTRYGVTENQAVILRGGRKFERFEVTPKVKFKYREKSDTHSIYFRFPNPVTQRVNGKQVQMPRPPIGFESLSETDMRAAETALNSIRGKKRP